jgi:hypothetical protein
VEEPVRPRQLCGLTGSTTGGFALWPFDVTHLKEKTRTLSLR